MVARAADPAADLEPVQPRHEHVENDGVVLPVRLEPLERLASVLGEVDVVALELERAAERVAHGRLVVDDQDLHGRIVRFESERGLRLRERH